MLAGSQRFSPVALGLMAAIILGGANAASAADPALIEAAKKEGEVVWYTVLIVNQAVRPLQAAFEKKYPGIKLKYARADEVPQAAKILAEAQAGKVQADVFNGLTNSIALKRGCVVAQYVPPAASQLPADLKDKDGYWHAILQYVFALGINTTLVPKASAPKTYQDLLDPKWQGKMAWNPNSMAGAIGFIGNILLSMGNERGMDYLKALGKQKVVNIEASSRAILDQVIAGEYPMGLMMFNNHTVISARKGAPSDWLPLEPAPVALDAIGVLKNAPHPNAARLLVDFVTSEDGQKVLRQSNYLPALPSVPALQPGLRPQDGGFKANFLGPDRVYDRIPEWVKIRQELFR